MPQIQVPYSSGIIELLGQYRAYAEARAIFLRRMDLSASCRDPLAEFSEVLVSRLLNAAIAGSRVQKAYDLIRSNGRLVQVKYLANPSRKWINEHHIHFSEGVDDYALVIFDSLQLEAVLLFPHETLGQVCSLLGKVHPEQHHNLQFTRRNFETILSGMPRFMELGMEIYTDFPGA